MKEKGRGSPYHTQRTPQLHLQVHDINPCYAICIRLNITQIANVPLGSLWSAMKLAKWIVMGACGHAPFSYVAMCAASKSRINNLDGAGRMSEGQGTHVLDVKSS